MRDTVKRLLDLFYPPRCVFCRRLLKEKERGVCPRCGQKYANTRVFREVAPCKSCVAAFPYEGQVRESLLRYKFRNLSGYGPVYAEFLAKCIDETGISCDSITWVPLSERRLRQRGYDQARILAEGVGEKLGLPCVRLLEKRVDTRPQSELRDAAMRRENAKGAYACCAPEACRGKRILLIDDIVTSGATLSECARVLKKAGCAEVTGAAAASR